MRRIIAIAFFMLSLLFLQGCEGIDQDFSLTVRFDSRGGSIVEEVTIDTTDYDLEFEEPTKEGHTFLGWYADLEYVDVFAYDFEDLDEESITLYAKWEVNTYTLILVDDEEAHELEIEYAFDLESVLEIEAEPGYVFSGWFLNEEKTISSEHATMPADDLVLYGKWEKQSFTLTFMDHDLSVLYQVSIPFDEFLEDSYSVSPERIGHTFNGWNIDLPNKMPAQDVIAMATYRINDYTVSFETGEGSEITALHLGYQMSFTVVDPVRTGHLFDGWFLEQSLKTPYTDFIVPAHDLTLYAKWVRQAYLISFDTNGGTPIESMEVLFMDPIVLPTTEKAGAVFDGWYFDTGFENPFTWDVMPAEHVSIVAKWIISEYQINYELLGGTNHEDNPLTSDGTVSIPLYEPTMEGFTFLGWYLDHHYMGEPVSEIVEGIVTDMFLFAKWQANQHTVTYVMTEEPVPDSFLSLNPEEVITDVAYGDNHTIFMTSEGRLFAFGENNYGQLGCGDNSFKNSPVEITDHVDLQEHETVVDLFAGTVNSGLLTSLGRVFLWGGNEYGQLTVVTHMDQNIPLEMTDSFDLFPTEEVTSVSIGSNHLIAITSHGRVFTWGKNNDGQLGNGTTSNYANMDPIDITSTLLLDLDVLEHPTFAFANDNVSVVVTSLNRVLVFGNNGLNQLGIGEEHASTSVAYDLTESFGLGADEEVMEVNIAGFIGGLYTSSNRLFVWGFALTWNEERGYHSVVTSITEITDTLPLNPGEDINDISFGSVTTITTTEGRVFMSGDTQMIAANERLTASVIPLSDRSAFFDLEEGEMLVETDDTSYTYRISLTSNGRLLGWGNPWYMGMGERWKTFYLPETLYIGHLNTLSLDTYFYSEHITVHDHDLEGYEFIGWFSDPGLKTPFDLTNMPDEDITVYGHYIKTQS